jgi:hypothetical protein
MNYEIAEATQSAINPGAVKDVYYYGETNTSKQAFPVVKNNRFLQQFANLTGGTSQFVISPNMGVSDIVCRIQLPVEGQSGATYANVFTQSGWAYQLVRTVSVRYGGSSQYFWTGAQMFAENLLDCENDSKKQQLINLGGTQGTGSALSGAEAYIYINLPHCSPRAEGKPLPFPSDLLTQPIVVTIELNPIPSIFGFITGETTGAPSALAAAELQVNQEYLQDSADALARRIDMNTHALSVPLKYFAQQEVLLRGLSAGAQSLILTGFRAGEVRDIMLWAEPVFAPGTPGAVLGQSAWYPLTNTTLTYNGEIFFTSNGNANQLWNLIEDKKYPGYDFRDIDPATGAGTGNTLSAQWTLVKFSQVDVPRDRMYDLISGKPILNAVVQLATTLPALPTLGGTSASSWTIHAVYFYNASLLVSRGTTDYVF